MDEVFQSSTEIEPRAGRPRVPACVTYVEISTGSRHLGVDTIINNSGDVRWRVTGERGESINV